MMPVWKRGGLPVSGMRRARSENLERRVYQRAKSRQDKGHPEKTPCARLEGFDALCDPCDLGEVMRSDVLGMGQVVAQRFEILADFEGLLF